MQDLIGIDFINLINYKEAVPEFGDSLF